MILLLLTAFVFTFLGFRFISETNIFGYLSAVIGIIAFSGIGIETTDNQTVFVKFLIVLSLVAMFLGMAYLGSRFNPTHRNP